MERLVLWDGVSITADAVGWGERELTGWSWEGTSLSKQGSGKMPLTSLAHAGLPGPQLPPSLLLSIPRALPGAAQARGSGGVRKDGSIPRLAPSAFASRLVLMPSGSLGRVVLHEGPWRRVPQMCLSILTRQIVQLCG